MPTLPLPAELDLPQDLLDKITNISRLSSLPQIVWQLMDLLRNDDVSTNKLQAIIEQDPALSAKTLSLANSAYYSLRQPATTIERAVVIIGFKELEFLAIGIGLVDIFDLKKMPPGFSGEDLWFHSLAVSWLARKIAEKTKTVNPSEVMLGGLLHDLGKFILASKLPKYFIPAIEESSKGKPYYQIEEEFKIWHTAIGYHFGQQWKLPPVHLAIILNHHQAQPQGEFAKSIATIILANQMIKSLNFGLTQESKKIDLKDILNTISLNKADYQEILKTLQKDLIKLTPTWQEMMKPSYL